MFEAVKTAWRHAMTEPNNATWCPVRLGACGTAVVYHAAAAWMVFGQRTHVDMTLLGQYIEHMAGLIGVATGALSVKTAAKADAKEGA